MEDMGKNPLLGMRVEPPLNKSKNHPYPLAAVMQETECHHYISSKRHFVGIKNKRNKRVSLLEFVLKKNQLNFYYTIRNSKDKCLNFSQNKQT